MFSLLDPQGTFPHINHIFNGVCHKTDKTANTGNDNPDNQNLPERSKRVKVSVPDCCDCYDNKIKRIKQGIALDDHQSCYPDKKNHPEDCKVDTESQADGFHYSLSSA